LTGRSHGLLDDVVDVVGQRLIWLGISHEPLDGDAAGAKVPALGRLAPADLRSRHLQLHVLDGMVASFYEVAGGDLASRVRRQAELSRPLEGLPDAISMASMSFLSKNIDVLLVVVGLGETPRAEVHRCVREVIAGVQTVAADQLS